MKVLILTPDYPPAPGGIQLLMGRLATSLPGAEVRVGTMGAPGAGSSERDEVLFRIPEGGGRGHRLRMAQLNLRGLLAARGWRPDVIVAGHVTTAPAAVLAGRLLRVPFAQYVHADEFRTRPSLSGWSVRQADAVIAVSGYAARLAEAGGAAPEKAAIILPGVDMPADLPARPAGGRPTILTVARMVAPYKGHDRLLAALPAVRERIPDVQWVVIGDGPRRVMVEADAGRMGLASAVRFLGAADDTVRDRWLREADVFAMPSRLPPDGVGGEGFGIVYLEAAAHGLPVVAGNVAGATDAVVDGETGLLVDPEDAEAIAAALIEVLAEPERAATMGGAGARRAEHLSWDRHAREVRAVLEPLIARGPV